MVSARPFPRFLLLVVALAILFPTVAHAQPQLYIDRAAWKAALGGKATDTVDFEDQPVTTTPVAVMWLKEARFEHLQYFSPPDAGLYIQQASIPAFGRALVANNSDTYYNVLMVLPHQPEHPFVEYPKAIGFDLLPPCPTCKVEVLVGFDYFKKGYDRITNSYWVVGPPGVPQFFGMIASPGDEGIIDILAPVRTSSTTPLPLVTVFDNFTYIPTLPQQLPNLVLSSLTLDVSEAPRGGMLVVTDTITNPIEGDPLTYDVTAGTSTTRYYLDQSSTERSSSSISIGGRFVPSLGPGVSNTATTNLIVPDATPPGYYYLIACADDLFVVDESKEGDNCRSTGTVRVVAPLPELTLNAAPIVGIPTIPIVPAENDEFKPAAVNVPFHVECQDDDHHVVECHWRVRLSVTSADAALGGHEQVSADPQIHDPDTRPIGLLKVGNVFGTGLVDIEAPSGDFVYTTGTDPVVAARVTFEVDCPDLSCMTRSWSVDLKVPDLVAVENADDLIVVGQRPEHGHVENNYATAAFGRDLRLYASQFRAGLVAAGFAANKTPRLTMTDLSLPWGGVYDVAKYETIQNVPYLVDPAGDWLPPHANHSLGTAADLRVKFSTTTGDVQATLTDAEKQTIRKILQQSLPGVDRFIAGVGEDPSAPNATHWHIQPKVDPAATGSVTSSVHQQSTQALQTACLATSVLTRATLSATVTPAGSGGYSYAYALTVPNDSASPVDAVSLRVRGPVTDVVAPAGWEAVISGDAQSGGTSGTADTLILFRADIHHLVGDPADDGSQMVSALALQPGATLSGFGFSSPHPPGPVPYEAMGRAPALVFASEDEAEAYASVCSSPSALGSGVTQGPSATAVVYLAEGATGTFFETQLALFNPNDVAATATLRFLKDTAETVTHRVDLPAHARRTVVASTVPGLESASFSTVIESGSPIVVDRTMTWDHGRYGSHAETAVPAPSAVWYLAEGSTSDVFSLFYLLQNPADQAVTATVRYLRSLGLPPVVKTYPLQPHSRTTIAVDGEGPEIGATDLSAVITATAPIIAERAMYRSSPRQAFAAGHESAGVTSPKARWFLAEGATGPFFDMFILIANPSGIDAQVRVDYLPPSGEVISKEYLVAANSRFTIPVDAEEIPTGSGQHPLINAAISSVVTSINDVPIIVERTMWWPSPETSPDFWTEAHNSAGAMATGTRWALAEGEVGGPQAAETYILLANTSTFAGQARVTLYFEDGTTAQRVYDLTASSRTSVPVSVDFPPAAGKKFGSLIESLGATPVQLVVERAMYSSPNGVTWAAGTNALATRLP